jgi:hypothetical protein
MRFGSTNGSQLDASTGDFYRRALDLMIEAGVPFLVGGAYAMERYTGIARHTKDFDIFVRPNDSERVLDLFCGAGFHTERTFPHWLAKAYLGDAFVDVIYRSGNGVAEVDQEWLDHGVPGEVLGRAVLLCPAEEILWSKGYIQERERYDGADVAHLLRACAERLDWGRLLRRFGADWRTLLSHLILFGFIYPAERARIPDWVLRDLLGRLQEEMASPPPTERVCQGTLLSRAQYLVDIESWGYLDARLAPRGKMTAEQIAHWTSAIDRID